VVVVAAVVLAVLGVVLLLVVEMVIMVAADVAAGAGAGAILTSPGPSSPRHSPPGPLALPAHTLASHACRQFGVHATERPAL
jgi:hypothetical protein